MTIHAWDILFNIIIVAKKRLFSQGLRKNCSSELAFKRPRNYTVQMAIKISSNKQLVVAKLEWFDISVTKQFFKSLRNVRYFLTNRVHSIKKSVQSNNII